MSYYTSKHPGLWAYLTLITATVLCFLYVEVTPTITGILSITWGGLALTRILALYEISEYLSPAKNSGISKNSNEQSSALAYDLIERMDTRENVRQGLRALACLHERTLGFFILALIYVGFSTTTGDSLFSKVTLVQNISSAFIIGAAFWIGQSYATCRRASTALCLTLCALFCLCVFEQSDKIFASLQLNEALMQDSRKLWLLTILISYCITTLLYAYTRGFRFFIHATAGLVMILLLSSLYVFSQPSLEMTALWISGWALFSVFWIKSHTTPKQTYVLYQSE